MLHKLRRAMVHPDRELLKDRVEVDETYIGGPEAGCVADGKSLTRLSLWAPWKSEAEPRDAFA